MNTTIFCIILGVEIIIGVVIRFMIKRHFEKESTKNKIMRDAYQEDPMFFAITNRLKKGEK